MGDRIEWNTHSLVDVFRRTTRIRQFIFFLSGFFPDVTHLDTYQKPDLKDNLSQMLKERLMQTFGKNLLPAKLIYPPGKPFCRSDKAVRDDINELFESKGKPGRRYTVSKNDRQYTPKAIPDVLDIDDDGIPCYHFPFFKETVSLIANIKILEIKDIAEVDYRDTVRQIVDDNVMKLYLDKAPSIVMELVERLIGCITQEFQDVALIDGACWEM